ncbi:MAG: polysaccharide biosynthesis tyrosine autokinase, partial [Deltaproteobacteria bacterium]|nr:polysaccharide biosynthesis tyrosine autokinase [Candidatus Tharpella sp.]
PQSKVVNHKKNFIGNKPTTLEKTAKTAKTKQEPLNFKTLEDNKIIYDCRIHPAADQFKILRTQLLQRLLSSGGNSVLITSPKPGEGKTVNAINLAISIAQEIDRTVLLIDANLRKPAIHKYFGLKESMGLADYLLGKISISEVLLNPGIDKLTILPGGLPLTTSSEMLGAARMADLVTEMKNRYEDRILVFDGPDILTNADSQVFSKLVDGIVLVVEAETTTRQEIKQAIERLGESPLIGTIFNKSHE